MIAWLNYWVHLLTPEKKKCSKASCKSDCKKSKFWKLHVKLLLVSYSKLGWERPFFRIYLLQTLKSDVRTVYSKAF